jgi:hypothetical protein
MPPIDTLIRDMLRQTVQQVSDIMQQRRHNQRIGHPRLFRQTRRL